MSLESRIILYDAQGNPIYGEKPKEPTFEGQDVELVGGSWDGMHVRINEEQPMKMGEYIEMPTRETAALGISSPRKERYELAIRNGEVKFVLTHTSVPL